MFPSQIIYCLVFILTGFHLGCEDPSLPLPDQSSQVGKEVVKSNEYVFGETNVSEMSLEIITGSTDDVCLGRDFVVVPEALPRGPLECEKDVLIYQARLINCGPGMITLTGLTFLFEIPEISGREDAERRLFERDQRRVHQLRGVRVCEHHDAERCHDTFVTRITEKSAVIATVFTADDVVQIGPKKSWVFDVRAARRCSRLTTSLLRLNLRLKAVEGVSDTVARDENIFGGILNPYQKIVISGWDPLPTY